jgi:hypothetical protein
VDERIRVHTGVERKLQNGALNGQHEHSFRRGEAGVSAGCILLSMMVTLTPGPHRRS